MVNYDLSDYLQNNKYFNIKPSNSIITHTLKSNPNEKIVKKITSNDISQFEI
jgi:hypothetical protein